MLMHSILKFWSPKFPLKDEKKLNTVDFAMNHPQKFIEYPGTVLSTKKTDLLKDYTRISKDSQLK